MNSGRFRCIGIFFFLVVVLTACGSSGAFSGSGEVVELTPEEVENFADEGKAGFIYAKDAVSTGIEEDKMIIRELKRVAAEQKIDIYIFDQYKHEKWIRDLGIDLSSQSLGFFFKNEVTAELDLNDAENQGETSKTVNQFIENVKLDYEK